MAISTINNGDAGSVVRGILNALIQAWNAFTSQNEITIVITGLTQIDMGSVSAYVVNLTSTNATETINRIINVPANTKIMFRPASGLKITFNDKVVGSGANISLNAASKDVDGTKSSYLELQKRTVGVNTYMFETGYIDQYN